MFSCELGVQAPRSRLVSYPGSAVLFQSCSDWDAALQKV